MLKISLTIFIMTLAMARPEPPANSYLPPRAGVSGVNGNGGQADLSTQYGTPNFGNGGGVNRNGGATSFNGLGGNGASNGPSKLYGAPIGRNAGRNGLGQSRENGFGGGQSVSSYGDSGGFGRNGNGRPSSTYGIPDANGNKNGFGNAEKPSFSYGVPEVNGNHGGGFGGNGKPSNSYGAPSANGNHEGGFGGNGGNGKPSSTYGAPGANGNRGGDFGGSNKPSDSYGAPIANGDHGGGFGENGGNGRPSNSYGVPIANGNANGKDRGRDNSNEGPSSRYGPPSESRTNDINGFGGANEGLSNSYGPPNRENGNKNGYSSGSEDARNFRSEGERDGGGGYNDNAQEESTEPAKYEFTYEVKDEQSGNDYSHTETRDGDRAQGEFNVLLPDGRKQIVEYEADQDGFKPQIRYEGEANAVRRYDSRLAIGNGNNDGYPSGRADSGGFAYSSGFNNAGGNSGYPNGGPREGKLGGFNSGGGNGYQSGRPDQSSRDHDDLSGDIGGYFSNAPSNNINGNDNINGGSNGQNDGNNGYQY